MSAPVEYGPARYRIVYADGQRTSHERTLGATIRWLAVWSGQRHLPVHVEPVAGTQYRLTYAPSGLVGQWWALDKPLVGALCQHDLGGDWRATALELRSPVQS